MTPATANKTRSDKRKRQDRPHGPPCLLCVLRLLDDLERLRLHPWRWNVCGWNCAAATGARHGSPPIWAASRRVDVVTVCYRFTAALGDRRGPDDHATHLAEATAPPPCCTCTGLPDDPGPGAVLLPYRIDIRPGDGVPWEIGGPDALHRLPDAPARQDASPAAALLHLHRPPAPPRCPARPYHIG